jgi:hypothetical protein
MAPTFLGLSISLPSLTFLKTMSSILSPTPNSHHPLTQSQKDTLLLQRLQKAIFPTTIYLADDFKHTYLISAENTTSNYPSTQTLPILTIYNEPENTVTHHVLLPRTLHPILSRKFAPSREIEKQGILPETTYWVGFDLAFMHRYKETSDFITALDQAMEIGGMTFIVDEPADAPVKAFMMEIRGLFRDEDDVLASAQRQVHILDRMVFGKYITLGSEVLGWTGEGEGDGYECESVFGTVWPVNGGHTPGRVRGKEPVSGSSSRKPSSVDFWFQ